MTRFLVRAYLLTIKVMFFDCTMWLDDHPFVDGSSYLQ